MNRCPRCNCEATGQNRLVTDSCGHSKCRLCLLADEVDCLECKIPKQLPQADASKKSLPETQLIPNGTSNHIKSTTLGYHCNVCDKDFRSRTQQYYHRACSNELLKKYICTQCPRRFASRSHLKYHQDSHSNHRYNCSICEKSFKQQIVLKRHMRAHDPPTLACQDCPRLFRTQSALTAHAVLHSGNNLPFKCIICSKHYLTKANLKQHQLKHDQVKNQHQCNVCNKSFLRSSTLALHKKRHSKRPRCACSHCFKTFSDVHALTRHMKQHTAKQRYRCLQCEVTVNRRDNMQRHMRSMHPEVQFDVGVQVLEAENSGPTTPVPAKTSAPTVRYNSVIKSVGNVEPIPQQKFDAERLMTVNPLPEQMQKENVKLYRKIILDLDNEEYSNEPSTGLDVDEVAMSVNERSASLHTQPQHQAGQGSSNFRHWRKNFKNCYENEHTN